MFFYIVTFAIKLKYCRFEFVFVYHTFKNKFCNYVLNEQI